MRQQICSRRPFQAPTGVFPPNKPAGLSSRSCVTSQVHEALLRAIFAPAGHRLSGVGRQPISASPVLFLANEVWITWLICCCLYDTNCHRPTNTRSFFSAPVAVFNEVKQRSDCVQAQSHIGGFHSHPEPNSSPPSRESYPLHR